MWEDAVSVHSRERMQAEIQCGKTHRCVHLTKAQVPSRGGHKVQPTSPSDGRQSVALGAPINPAPLASSGISQMGHKVYILALGSGEVFVQLHVPARSFAFSDADELQRSQWLVAWLFESALAEMEAVLGQIQVRPAQGITWP